MQQQEEEKEEEEEVHNLMPPPPTILGKIKPVKLIFLILHLFSNFYYLFLIVVLVFSFLFLFNFLTFFDRQTPHLYTVSLRQDD